MRAVGVVREDGSIDYPLILQVIALATRDECLKQAILKFCVEMRLTWKRGLEGQ